MHREVGVRGLNKANHRAKPHTAALFKGFGREKRVEDLGQVRLRNAPTLIRDDETGIAADWDSLLNARDGALKGAPHEG